ncbi:hypothetical protein [Beijerinckia sp. L45]|uniref:hypothetical protein n=1 Tax=Beijerinckia sp. L45 TaxID=1641855 RepID=UPI00131DE321|nr:hypothetical protein [Beijerinckia sp. L45]
MSKRDDERIKYLATLVNTCAASCFTVGVVAPIAAAFYGAPPDTGIALFMLGTFVWLCAALSLHFSVRRILGRLR